MSPCSCSSATNEPDIPAHEGDGRVQSPHARRSPGQGHMVLTVGPPESWPSRRQRDLKMGIPAHLPGGVSLERAVRAAEQGAGVRTARRARGQGCAHARAPAHRDVAGGVLRGVQGPADEAGEAARTEAERGGGPWPRGVTREVNLLARAPLDQTVTGVALGSSPPNSTPCDSRPMNASTAIDSAAAEPTAARLIA